MSFSPLSESLNKKLALNNKLVLIKKEKEKSLNKDEMIYLLYSACSLLYFNLEQETFLQKYLKKEPYKCSRSNIFNRYFRQTKRFTQIDRFLDKKSLNCYRLAKLTKVLKQSYDDKNIDNSLIDSVEINKEKIKIEISKIKKIIDKVYNQIFNEKNKIISDNEAIERLKKENDLYNEAFIDFYYENKDFINDLFNYSFPTTAVRKQQESLPQNNLDKQKEEENTPSDAKTNLLVKNESENEPKDQSEELKMKFQNESNKTWYQKIREVFNPVTNGGMSSKRSKYLKQRFTKRRNYNQRKRQKQRQTKR